MEPNDPRTRLAETLWNDPETRPHLEAAMVRKFGDKAKAAIPYYQEREQLAKDRQEYLAEREQHRAEREQEKAAAELERERQKVLNDPELRLRREELPAVEKLMQDQLIGTHTAAAKLYRAEQQVQAPRGFSFAAEIPGLNGAGGDEYKGLLENPEQWARTKSAEIIADFRSGRGDRWL